MAGRAAARAKGKIRRPPTLGRIGKKTMVKTMRVGRYGRAALAATVALALVQVPALAQTNSKSAPLPAATAPAAAAPTPAAAPTATGPATADSGPIDPFAHGTAAAGATKSAVCSSCHGPNGNSSKDTPQWPRLAG